MTTDQQNRGDRCQECNGELSAGPDGEPSLDCQACQLRARVKELEKALKDLVTRLDVVHDDPQYYAVWMTSHIHIGPYNGPQYKDELDRARVLITAPK